MDVVIRKEFLEDQVYSGWGDWYEFFASLGIKVYQSFDKRQLSDEIVVALAGGGLLNFREMPPSGLKSCVQLGGCDEFTSQFRVDYSGHELDWSCVVSIPCGVSVKGLEYYFASNVLTGRRPSFDFLIEDGDHWELTPCADAELNGGIFVSRSWFAFSSVWELLFDADRNFCLDDLFTLQLEGLTHEDVLGEPIADTVLMQQEIIAELKPLISDGWKRLNSNNTLVVVGRVTKEMKKRNMRVDSRLMEQLASRLIDYLSSYYGGTWKIVLGIMPYGQAKGANAVKRRLFLTGGPNVFDLTNELGSIREDKRNGRPVDVRVTTVFSPEWENLVERCLSTKLNGVEATMVQSVAKN